MGTLLIGLKPKNKDGAELHRSFHGWTPCLEMMDEIDVDRFLSDDDWIALETNDGLVINEKKSTEIANRLEYWLAKNDWRFSKMDLIFDENFPNVTHTDERIREDKYWRLEKPGYDQFTLSLSEVRELINFFKSSGGFQVT